MKQLFITALFISLISTSQAQVKTLPLKTVVDPFRLEVGYNFNTTLHFPGTVKKAYWGVSDIMAQTVPDVDNVLLVKAAREDFKPTNLHVFTGNGTVYCFNVFYAPTPAQTTFDLAKLDSTDLSPAPVNVSFSDQLINDDKLQLTIQEIVQRPATLSKARTQYDMKFRLQGIYFTENLLFFSFRLTNLSGLDYQPAFLRLYIKDQKRSKRSSFQDREMVPVNRFLPTTVAGDISATFVVAVPKFTIPKGKLFYVELYEHNGGRNISMNVKNRHLFKAKRIAYATKN